MSTSMPHGRMLLRDPLKNKDVAFTFAERDKLKLHGFLPAHESNINEQCIRAYHQLQKKESDIEKHIFLRNLQDTNEVLFYALITRHIEEMLPLVYTPVVGDGCLQFSHIYRHPRGLFVSYPLQDRMEELFAHPCFDHVRVIVVTDGERILGLGDQGANGMGIPIGKLSLYTACAGIHPNQTLPVMLDVGTNNAKILNEPLYIGWHHERIRGAEYDQFIEKFVTTVEKRFPHVLLQWEDFAQQNANPILAQYRDRLCTFNDDIQGTAAVAVGTLLAAIQVTGIPLQEQKIAILGGGSAGCGISHLIVQAMQEAGLSDQAARERIYIVDRLGLLRNEQKDLQSFQKPFVKSQKDYGSWDIQDPKFISLFDVVKNYQPTVLIGVSGVAHAFKQNIIEEMAKHVERPIIFPLSNPTSHAEATPEQLSQWTHGRAIIGTGSPFPPLSLNGTLRTVDQTNNAYIFPGLGLGLIAAKARHVTDKMLMLAARTLAENSPAAINRNAPLLPTFNDIRHVSLKIAETVALEAFHTGLTPYEDQSSLIQSIKDHVWEPHYKNYS
jgi:malate dehydrogenase (oxaloacetate-decarboxylating)